MTKPAASAVRLQTLVGVSDVLVAGLDASVDSPAGPPVDVPAYLRGDYTRVIEVPAPPLAAAAEWSPATSFRRRVTRRQARRGKRQKAREAAKARCWHSSRALSWQARLTAILKHQKKMNLWTWGRSPRIGQKSVAETPTSVWRRKRRVRVRWVQYPASRPQYRAARARRQGPLPPPMLFHDPQSDVRSKIAYVVSGRCVTA